MQLGIPSGREISGIAVGFLPRSVRYFPGSERVIFKQDRTLGDFETQVWDLRGGAFTCIEGEEAVQFTGMTPISETELVSFRKRGRLHSFVWLRSRDCALFREVPSDPDAPESMFSSTFSAEEPAISPDSSTAAYIVRYPKSGPDTMILRSLVADLPVKRIRAPEGWLFGGARFTPDSRLILAVASRKGMTPSGSGGRHCLFFYEAVSGQLVRTLEIDGRDGLAFSPDGRLMAAGSNEREDLPFGGERVKAIAVLYDFASGQEVARVEHPWFKWRRGMWGMLTGLEFSADGQYLVTSTHDVRIWRIGPPKQN